MKYFHSTRVYSSFRYIVTLTLSKHRNQRQFYRMSLSTMSSPKTMLAAHFMKMGGIMETKVSPIEKPAEDSLASGQLLVRVHAASLNILDLRVLKGELKVMLKTKLPAVVGFDFSGTVEATNGSRFNVGDEVFGMVKDCKQGSVAEHILVDDAFCALKPESKSHEEASAIPVVGFTALMAFEKSQLKKHEHPKTLSILILCGSGGVGTMAIQLAKNLYNATFIAATTSGGSKADLAKSLGADVVVNYHDKDMIKQLKVHGPYDVVFHGAGEVGKAVGLVDKGGALVSVAAPPNAKAIKEWLDSFESNKAYNGFLYSVVSSWLGKVLLNRLTGYTSISKHLARKSASYHPIIANGTKAMTATLSEEFNAGRIKAVIEKEIPLENVVEGLKHLEDGHASGKIVVTIPSST